MRTLNVFILVFTGLFTACGVARFQNTDDASRLFLENENSADLALPEQEPQTENLPIIIDEPVKEIEKPGSETVADKTKDKNKGAGKAPPVKNPPPPAKPQYCSGYKLSCKALPANIFLPDALIQNMNLMQVDLSSKNVSRGRFYDNDLQQACGHDSEFSDSVWQNISLYQAGFQGSNFSRASMTSINLQAADFSLSNFSQAKLQYINMSGACVEASNFSQVEFVGQTQACGLKAARSNFSAAHIQAYASFCQADFEAANLSAIRIDENVDFSQANFRRANLSGAVIHHNVNFSGADFSGATWIDGRICGADSIGACR